MSEANPTRLQDVMLAWWWPSYSGPGSAAFDGRALPPWAGYVERTLIQKSFAWATASLMMEAGQAGWVGLGWAGLG